MLANPVKGDTPVPGTSYVLCYSWPAQKVVGKRFGKRFRDVMLALETIDDDGMSFLFWAGFQHHHPELTEDATDGLISTLGFVEVTKLIDRSIRAAYDIPDEAPDGEAPADATADPPPPTRGSRKAASGSGSSSS